MPLSLHILETVDTILCAHCRGRTLCVSGRLRRTLKTKTKSAGSAAVTPASNAVSHTRGLAKAFSETPVERYTQSREDPPPPAISEG